MHVQFFSLKTTTSRITFLIIILSSTVVTCQAQSFEKIVNNATDALQQGDVRTGLKLLLEAQSLARENNKTNTSGYASVLNNLGYAYTETAQYLEAQSAYLEGLQIYKKLGMQNTGEYADALDNIGTLYHAVGLYAQAKTSIEHSLSLRAKLFGEDSQPYATALHNLASIESAMGNKTLAIKYLKKTLELKAKFEGKLTSSYATTLNNLGTNHHVLGRHEEAAEFIEEAISIQEQILKESDLNYLLSLDNLGQLKRLQGHYNESHALHNKCLNIIEKYYGKQHPQYAVSLSSVSQVLLKQGKYGDLEEIYKQIISIYESNTGSKTYDYAIALNNLASFYNIISNYDGAIDYFSKSLSIFKNVIGEENEDYITTSNNLSIVYQKMGNDREAKTHALKAVSLCGKLPGENGYVLAKSLNVLGSIFIQSNEYEEALIYLHQAYDIYKNLQTSRFKLDGYGDLINNMSIAYMSVDNRTEMTRFMEENINLAEQSSPGSERYGTALNNYLQYLVISRQYKKIAPYAQLLLDGLYLQINDVLPTLSEKERLQYVYQIQKQANAYRVAILIAQVFDESLAGEILQLNLNVKGLAFSASNQVAAAIQKKGDKNLIADYENWNKRKRYLSQLIQDPNSNQKHIHQTRAEVNDMEKQLSRTSAEFSESMVRDINWKDIQSALGPTEAFIDISRSQLGDTVYLMTIVKPENNIPIIIMKNGRDLEGSSIEAYRNGIKYRVKDSKSYGVYWKDVDEELKGFDKVYLSSDGLYHQINIGTLFHEEEGAYMIEKYQIIRIASLENFTRKRKKDVFRTKDYIALIGFPNYSLVPKNTDLAPKRNTVPSGSFSEQRFMRGNVIVSLPETRTEVQAIHKISTKHKIKTIVLLGDEATEMAVKRLEEPKVLHIATHGFFLTPEELKVSDIKIPIQASTYERQLLRSGLLLAGAQIAIDEEKRGTNDGILTALEVSGMDLENTDVTVLSACETGLGDIVNGEGVLGLSRAFLQAGSKSLIMSLWEVSDTATRDMMIAFYTNYLIHGFPKEKALHQAQLEIMETHEHPYFWGSFVIINR